MATKILLDTTILIDFLRRKADAIEIVDKLRREYELCTSDINAFEVFYGAYLSSNVEKNIAAAKGLLNTLNVVNTSIESAETAGKILAGLDKKGQKIELRDVFIAGICIVNSFPVVTFDTEHFERMNVKIVKT